MGNRFGIGLSVLGWTAYRDVLGFTPKIIKHPCLRISLRCIVAVGEILEVTSGKQYLSSRSNSASFFLTHTDILEIILSVSSYV